MDAYLKGGSRDSFVLNNRSTERNSNIGMSIPSGFSNQRDSRTSAKRKRSHRQNGYKEYEERKRRNTSEYQSPVRPGNVASKNHILHDLSRTTQILNNALENIVNLRKKAIDDLRRENKEIKEEVSGIPIEATHNGALLHEDVRAKSPGSENQKNRSHEEGNSVILDSSAIVQGKNEATPTAGISKLSKKKFDDENPEIGNQKSQENVVVNENRTENWAPMQLSIPPEGKNENKTENCAPAQFKSISPAGKNENITENANENNEGEVTKKRLDNENESAVISSRVPSSCKVVDKPSFPEPISSSGVDKPSFPEPISSSGVDKPSFPERISSSGRGGSVSPVAPTQSSSGKADNNRSRSYGILSLTETLHKVSLLLPPSATCQSVTKLLEDAGLENIDDVVVICKPHVSNAWVTFGNIENQQKAISLSGKLIVGGQPIEVRLYKDDNWGNKNNNKTKMKNKFSKTNPPPSPLFGSQKRPPR